MQWRLNWLLGPILWLVLVSISSANGDYTAELVQVDISQYPDVTLYISVRDGAGQIVEGLSEENFEITEDGAAVDIAAFSAGNRAAITTVLTIDRSGSMDTEGKLTGAKIAAATFVDLMRDKDKAAVVTFDSDVVTLQPFTSDRELIKRQIQSIRTGGCTAWYDGVYDSIDLVATLAGRRSVILLSDGIDCGEDLVRKLLGGGSTHSLGQAIKHAREAEIPVYTIGFGKKATDEVGNEGYDEEKLSQVATDTKGKFYHAPNVEELKRLYQTLSVEMQKEYVVTYRSPRPTYDGTRRNIVIAVAKNGGATVTTQGRYLEQHLVNIQSDWRIFLLLLVPLVLLLLVPFVASGTKANLHLPFSGKGRKKLDDEEHKKRDIEDRGSAKVSKAEIVTCYPLVGQPLTIGRSPENDIVITHPSVALQHAQLYRQGKWFAVRSRGAGQIFVSFDGDPAKERQVSENALKNDSTVRIGDVRCVVRLSSDDADSWLAVPNVLEKLTTTIGSDPTNDIIINAPDVSPRHLEIRWESKRYVAYNVSGGHNLFVSFSGLPAQERPMPNANALKSGSTLKIGDFVFRLSIPSDQT